MTSSEPLWPPPGHPARHNSNRSGNGAGNGTGRSGNGSGNSPPPITIGTHTPAWPQPTPQPEQPPSGEHVMTEDELSTAVDEINTGLDEEIAHAGEDPVRRHMIISEQVRGWVQRQAAAGQHLLGRAEQIALVRAVQAERFGFGALQPYLDDPDVEEIDVNGPQVWIHYAGGRKVGGPRLARSDAELADKVRRWASRGAREFSPARPMLNVSLGVGVRMAATMAVSTQVHVAIRKQRLLDLGLDELIDLGTLEPPVAQLLAAAVRARLDIMVTGGVSAGKTTFLRALCSCIDSSERIITLESERELHLDQLERHPDVVSFQAREANQEGVGAVSLTDLIPQTLRMNPDRILVGEVRHAEMLALLQAIDNGLEGSLTTLHANSGAEVFSRILTLCAYSAQHIDQANLFKLIGRAVDLVVHLRRDRATGRRYVAEIIEVLEPAEGSEPAINRIAVPGPDGTATPAGVTPARIGELEAAGFDRHLLRPDPGSELGFDSRVPR